jgi:putative ABC transport system substrate-binding protein
MPDKFLYVHRTLIISLAVRNNVPSVSNVPSYVREGGLISYTSDNADVFHRAASYVDRMLRGAKPAELPVQLPFKFESLNIKTAKALGLKVPLRSCLAPTCSFRVIQEGGRAQCAPSR